MTRATVAPAVPSRAAAAWARFVAGENRVHALLVRRSIAILRIALGANFFAFGILKYFPGVSPAQDLAEKTTHLLFLGLVPDPVSLVIVATMECAIGLLLMSGKGMRIAVYLLVAEFIGILSPLVLLTGRLFPDGAPTLEAQYILKDIVLVAAAFVIAAGSFRGGRLVRTEPAPASPRQTPPADARRRLAIVLAPVPDGRTIEDVCEEHRITLGTYHEWRDAALDGAADALERRVVDDTAGGDRVSV